MLETIIEINISAREARRFFGVPGTPLEPRMLENTMEINVSAREARRTFTGHPFEEPNAWKH
jgi:hypothetical protein